MRSSDDLAGTTQRSPTFDMAELGPPRPAWQRLLRRIDLPVQLGRIAVVSILLYLWHSKFFFNGISIFGIEIIPKLKRLFYATPGEVWDYLSGLPGDDLFWKNLKVTLHEAVLGFTFGGSLGLIAGLILGRFRRLAKVFSPLLTLANAAPKIALGPVLIVWYGVDIGSKVALATLIVFFIVQVPVQAAASLVDPDLDTVATTMGANEFQKFRKVIMPGILPAIFGALRLGSVYAVLSVVFGEFLASRRGLGQELLKNSSSFNMGAVFGLLFVLSLLALAFNALIGLLERRFMRWNDKSGQGTVLSL